VQNAHDYRPEQNEEKEDDILYAVMEYKLRTKLWFLWPIVILGDIASVVYFLIDKSKNGNPNVFLNTFVVLNSCASFSMALFWLKNLIVYKIEEK